MHGSCAGSDGAVISCGAEDKVGAYIRMYVKYVRHVLLSAACAFC